MRKEGAQGVEPCADVSISAAARRVIFFGGDGVSKISAAAAFGGVTVNNRTHKFSGTSNIHYIDCSIGSLISRVTVEFWRYGL